SPGVRARARERLVPGGRGGVACGDARAPAPAPGADRGQPGPGAPDDAPPVPGDRGPLALVPLSPRPGGLPRRRHGTGQDRPGAGLAPAAEDWRRPSRGERPGPRRASSAEPPRRACDLDLHLATGYRGVRPRSRATL